MKPIGKVLHSIGPLFILRSNKIKIRDIGSDAFIKEKKIGKVIELFGPVKKPYIKVVSKKDIKDKKSFIGKDVSIR